MMEDIIGASSTSTNDQIRDNQQNGEDIGAGQNSSPTPSSERDVTDDHRTNRTEEINVDLSGNNGLMVDISDALSERDRVKYTVHTKTAMKEFSKTEMSVVRDHEEFRWLHSCFEENEALAGYINPPCPPRPDFDASREKLQKLSESEATLTREEFQKMKQELEQEYLATFKKTVAMHEVFLCRLAAHPVFCHDENLRIFLEYDSDLSVRGKNKREKLGSIWRHFTQSADEVLLAGQRDVEDFFDQERHSLLEYHASIKEATAKADRVARLMKQISDMYDKIGGGLEKIATSEKSREIRPILLKSSECFEKLRKLEARVSSDEELKQADTLRYFMRETQAAKDLLYRRLRRLANYEAANKNLERARARNKDVAKAETEQQEACQKFEDITGVAKGELKELKRRRVSAFQKNLIELAELEVKHAKAKLNLLTTTIGTLKQMDV